jgi:hypothetical protein
MASEFTVDLIDLIYLGILKQGPHTRWSQHVHEDQVLTGYQLARGNETLGEKWIVQGCEKDEQGTLVQSGADEGAKSFEIGCHSVGLQRIEFFPTCIVMALARASAEEGEHSIAESDEAKLIALPLCRGPQDQGSGDVSVQRSEMGGWAGCIRLRGRVHPNIARRET